MTDPEINSLTAIPKKLIVFLHGVGSDGDDLIALAPYIQQDLPDCHFFSPHGIEPYDMAPFGRQWFSLKNRSPNVLSDLIAISCKKVQEIIENKQTTLGLTNKETILIGFSQGTMLSLYLNLSSGEPFNAIIGFSGALIPPAVCLNIITPICLIHGAEDEIIDISALHKASIYLKDHNINHKSYAIPNLKHSINDEGLKLAVNFIKEMMK